MARSHQEKYQMSQPADRMPGANAEAHTPLRFVTAASLFDGHDAAINIMRRLIQAQGVEVIHLGHNRSVLDIVLAAIQEDADAIAISSYQGGHVEFFKYMVDLLKERGAGRNGRPALPLGCPRWRPT
jgi:methylmalonyl-CoA mutase